MIATYLQSTLAIAGVLALGYPLARWLTDGQPGWSMAGRLAVSWMTGLGLITLMLLTLSMAGLSLRSVYGLGLAGGAVALVWVGYRRWRQRSATRVLAQPRPVPWKTIDWVLALVVVWQFVFSLVTALHAPINTRDAWANWGLKGKAFFIEDAVTHRNIRDRHNYYPILVPASLTWVYLGIGKVDDRIGKIIFPLCLLALVGLVYQMARLLGLGRRPALGLTAYLATAGGMLVRQATLAQADLPLGTFYAFAGLSFLAWIRQPHRLRYVWAAGVGASLMVMTKYEGLLHVLILAVSGVALALWNWRRRQAAPMPVILVAFSLPVIIGGLPWVIFTQIHNIPIDNEHLGALQIERLPIIVGAMSAALMDLPRWGLVWPLWLMMAGRAALRPRSQDQQFLDLVTALNLAFFVATYLTTEHRDLKQQISDTVHRLLLHIYPLAVAGIGLGVYRWLEDGKLTANPDGSDQIRHSPANLGELPAIQNVTRS